MWNGEHKQILEATALIDKLLPVKHKFLSTFTSTRLLFIATQSGDDGDSL